MKKYIILGWCGGMGGGHVYTRNKCKVVKELGWEPIVIHFSHKLPIIEELKTFTKNAVYEMAYPPSYYSISRKKEILQKFVDIIRVSENDEFFVESNGVRYSYWGELLAELLNCKHYVFLVEAFIPWKDNNKAFYKFKNDREEFSTIKIENYESIFGQKFLCNRDKIHINVAFCSNSVEDVKDNLNIDYSKYDFIIGHIGRLSKPYVAGISKDVAQFAGAHKLLKILFIVIGGDNELPITSKFKDDFSNINNLTFINTGFLFPIPKSLLTRLNVGIGSAGCLRLGVKYGIPTIAFKDEIQEPFRICTSIDDINNLGDAPCQQSLCELLSKSIEMSKMTNGNTIYPDANYIERWAELKRDTYYMIKPSSKNYYDTSLISKSSFLCRLYVTTVGRVLSFARVLKLI